MNGPDYIVEIGSQGPRIGPDASPQQQGVVPGQFAGRPWLAVHWRCCQVYSRVYRNRQGTAYQGRCPRCGWMVTARIGAGGTDCRFFEAG
jgi:hypothetical protein